MENKEEGRIIVLREQQNEMVEKVKKIVISSKKDFDNATEYTRSIKVLRKQFVELKDFLVKPIKDHVKVIEAQFKPHIEKCDVIEDEVKLKCQNWWANEEIKRQKEEERLRKEQEERFAKEVKEAEDKGGDIPPPPAPIVAEKPKTEGASMRTVPDKDKIEKAIEEGVRVIDGVKIWQKWVYSIEQASLVPAEYRKLSMAISTKETTEGL